MTIHLRVPTHDDTDVSYELNPSDILFVLGPNGSGKSGLIQHWFAQHPSEAIWVSAHRQTWFDTSLTNMTPQQGRQYTTNFQREDREPRARTRDADATRRTSLTKYKLFKLIIDLDRTYITRLRNSHVDNLQNQEVSSNGVEAIVDLHEDPLDILNELLRYANIPVDISLNEDFEFRVTKNGSGSYGIDQLSDGERAAFLLAGEVLTAKPGNLILIDEPERHLHRSINASLLTALFEKRKDCVFVIATHELTLPIDHPNSETLLVRNCRWDTNHILSWQVDQLTDQAEIDEDLKKAIVGARRTILFVEGSETSLDPKLYRILFPDISVIPKVGRGDIERAVKSIKASEELHWLQPYGLIDNDGFDADQIDDLASDDIYSIKRQAVESIYYDVKIQEAVARLRTAITGEDPEPRLNRAKNSTINEATRLRMEFVEHRVDRRLHGEFMRNKPNKTNISMNTVVSVEIDIPGILQEELEILDHAINQGDADFIIQRYPIKSSGIPNFVAHQLGFDDEKEYEKAVLQLLKDDESILTYVYGLLGDLPQAIAR